MNITLTTLIREGIWYEKDSLHPNWGEERREENWKTDRLRWAPTHYPWRLALDYWIEWCALSPALLVSLHWIPWSHLLASHFCLFNSRVSSLFCIVQAHSHSPHFLNAQILLCCRLFATIRVVTSVCCELNVNNNINEGLIVYEVCVLRSFPFHSQYFHCKRIEDPLPQH